MNELGNKYALAALRHKRATLAAELVTLEKQAAWKRQQLAHVDATLALFGEADPDAIRPVKPYKRIALFKQGELSRHVIDALRRGARPMRLAEIVEAATADLGHGRGAIPALQHRLRASLQYLLRAKGKVTKAGNGQRVTWTLKP
jgi:hypothetical protein